MEITIISPAGKTTVMIDGPARLSDALRAAGAEIDLPCSGNGRCGKCRVKVDGELLEPSEQECNLLSEQELAAGIRLSCLATAIGDCTIHSFQQIDNSLQGMTDNNTESLIIDPPSADQELRVAAIDIGTTTICARFYSLPEGKLLAVTGRVNPQRRFGADVISRIRAAGEGHLEEMSLLVREAVEGMCIEAGIRPDKMVVTGNTTMLHLFANLDPTPMGKKPFIPKTLFGTFDQNIYYPPCVSAYVGADTVSAMLACNILKHKTALLVDLGTNGELALINNGRIFTTTAAAGPAFEGVGIKQGMSATDGAIDKVFYKNGNFEYHVIGECEEVGICGSGIVDAAAAAIESGMADESGYMEDTISLGSVRFEPQDIRNYQLAKAAIRAGIECLLAAAEIETNEVEALYLCGGFGSYINIESAAKTGLIPKELISKTKAMGDAALSGASMLLLNKSAEQELLKISSICESIELVSFPGFNEQFILQMGF